MTFVQLEERDVPATTFTGTVFLDTNANGAFENVATTINNVGSGTTTLTAESGWSGLSQPWDPVSSRVPVTIQAFDVNNVLQGQTTTNLDGTYTLTVTTGGSYRLEFSNLPAGVSFGPSGQTTGTAVQMANVTTNGTTAGVNLGLIQPENITPDNPILATSSYVFGAYDNVNTANLPTVESFPYNSGGSITNPVPPTGNGTAGSYTAPDSHTIQIPHNQVGATWGLAYNRQTNQIYMATFTKAHTGYGPRGNGVIYAADATPTGSNTTVTTATPFVDLAALAPGSTGVNYRTDPNFSTVNTNGADPYISDGLYLDANGKQVGWDAVGKTGLGGLANDPTGRYLFTVALGDRKLYIIDTQNPTAAPIAVTLPVPSNVTGVTGTNPLGDLRPFAVEYYKGSVYIGAVNSAESTITDANPTGDPAALRAYVFQFKLNTNSNGALTGTGQFVDLNGAATTPATAAVLDISLNYNRGFVQPGMASNGDTFAPVSANWLPWSPVYKNLTDPLGPINNIGIYPQPELTGLAFDQSGNVTLGLRDRAGDQFGVQTPADVNNPTKLYTGITGGDTLRAFIDPKTTGATVTSRWTLESNGAGPNGAPASLTGQGNGQGPGGGEFYAGDFLVPGINAGHDDHQEVSSGGVLQLPGYADVAVTSFDPAQLSQRYNTGGVRWYRNYATAADNQTGNAVRGYELYRSEVNFGVPSNTFAKSNGIGDLIAITPTPIEIGNRIWADMNRDGRQDPNEPGLGGVQVVLFNNGNPIATATTDVNGNYYFTSMVDPGTGNQVAGKAYGVNLLPNTSYQIQIPLGQPALAALSLTTSLINGGAEPQRDSNAIPTGTNGVITLSTGLNGTVDHTFDAGFQYELQVGDFVWNDKNNDGIWEQGEQGLGGVTVQLLDSDSNTLLAATTTNAQGGYLFQHLNPGNYRVRIPLDTTTNPGLQGFLSSSGTNGSGTGVYEPANGVPVQQPNNQDSGVTQTGGQFVLGPVVPATVGGAPRDETTTLNGDLGIATDRTLDSSSYRNQDFGFYQPVSIGDVVWVDTNNNGVRDTGEKGLAGVTVLLMELSGTSATMVGSTTTNANGGYLFTNLAEGTYQVKLVRDSALTGYRSSTGAVGSVGPFEPSTGNKPNDQDHGTETTGFILGPVLNATIGGATPVDPATIPGGLQADPAGITSQYHTQDFGVFQPLQLGNLVWEDTNNNGIQDNGELGVPGIVVELLDASGNPVTDGSNTPITTTTIADGTYLFTNLVPGQYRVRITAPAGYMSSSGTNGSMTGPFEPGLPGTDLTNSADHGTQIAGTQQIITSPVTLALPGTTDNPDLSSDGIAGMANLRQDFGIYRKVSIGDFVWNDINNNGAFDTGEPAIPGVTVRLLDGSGNPILSTGGVAMTTTTAADGGYLFTNLIPGLYQVEVVIPAGYKSSTGTNGSGTGTYEPVVNPANPGNNLDHGTTQSGGTTVRGPIVNLQVGQAPLDDENGPASATAQDVGVPNDSSYRNQDFGFYQPLSLGDYVWNDINNDGVFNNSEPALGGVTVRLLDGSGNPVIGAGGVAMTTTTASDGGYLFTNLAPGQYQVEVVIPAGFKSSTGTNGSTTGTYEPVVNPANPGNNLDHGTTQSGGTTVRGPVVNLQVGQAPLDDENGPASATTQDAGVLNANSYRNQDFGFYQPLTVGDQVWRDDNNNGVRDTGEPGIGGVTVMLLDGNGNMITSTITNPDGTYLFTDLAPGSYCVKITPPAGLVSSTGGAGSPFEPAPETTINDNDKGTTQTDGTIKTQKFTLGLPGSSENPSLNGFGNLTQDFGLYTPLAIGDQVWLDSNNNGVRDTGEPGIAGVGVMLLDGNGNMLAATTTDSNGLYRFNNLTAGSYMVKITPPTGLQSSTGGTGSPYEPAAESLINDADKGTTQANGTIKTQTFVLTPTGNPDENGTANLRQDFGLFSPPPPPPPALAQVSGYVYVDANINGVKDAGEKPIPGTRVYLTGTDDSGNTVSKNVLTDINGFYQFTGLAPGTYTVREQQPDGSFYNGSTNVGTVGGSIIGTKGNDILSSIRLNSNDAGINYNFGEFPNAATFGYTWVDTNRNGVYDSSESPIPGVAVTISGTAFAGTQYARPLTAADVPGGLTVYTNSKGRYDFPTLPYGTYNLQETQPKDYDDWMEQDGDPNSSQRPTITNDLFTGIVFNASAPIRGPFNYGEILSGSNQGPNVSPQAPGEPSKRDFLSSSSSTAVVQTAGLSVAPVQPAPGVVSAVSFQQLQPQFNTAGLSSTTPTYVVAAAGAGNTPLVRVFDYATGIEKFRFLAYEQSYTGGVRTTVADINGDGVPDIITATGVGGGPRIRVFSGLNGSVLMDFFALESTYTGGLYVAAGDVNGDGHADIIVGTDQGGAPRVKVIAGMTGQTLQDFFAFDSSQRGGVRVAAADMNNDGRTDLIAVTGAGVPTRVRVYDSATNQVMRDFAPYGNNFTGGVYVSAGDFNGDGTPDIVTGAGEGGGPHIQVFSGTDNAVLASFFAYESTFTGGVRVAAVDLNGDSKTEIVAAAGSGGGARVTIFSGPNINTIDDFFAFDATMLGGTYVGAGSASRTILASTGTPAETASLGLPGSLPG